MYGLFRVWGQGTRHEVLLAVSDDIGKLCRNGWPDDLGHLLVYSEKESRKLQTTQHLCIKKVKLV